MHQSTAWKPPLWRLILISLAALFVLIAAQGKAQTNAAILEPVSETEFHHLFGIRSLDLLVAERQKASADLASAKTDAPFRDLSIDILPSIRPHPPLKQRYVLPDEFAILDRAPLATPTLVVAGYTGQPEISELGCATREHSQHNLAYRCNAPIALNVPGGENPSASFLKEMEAETGLRIGYDLWPGDKDAVTGDRLLSARDVVTGMRFTLRYLDQRGFTVAKASCAERSQWRWSYICLHDDAWAAMSAADKCEFVLDGLLTVEGGAPNWSFAPLPSPGTAAGDLIAIGLTVDPTEITDTGKLCQELRAQERLDQMLLDFIKRAPDDLGLRLVSLAEPDSALLSLSARFKGKEMIVGYVSSETPSKLPKSMPTLAKLWRGLSGLQVCDNVDCSGPIEVALPPLPDYRPKDVPLPSDNQIAEQRSN